MLFYMIVNIGDAGNEYILFYTWDCKSHMNLKVQIYQLLKTYILCDYRTVF